MSKTIINKIVAKARASAGESTALGGRLLAGAGSAGVHAAADRRYNHRAHRRDWRRAERTLRDF